MKQLYLKYNNITTDLMQQSQFISNFNHLYMFRAIISPILRSTGLCLQLVVQCTEEVTCW